MSIKFMIILSTILCIFANYIRFAELVDYTIITGLKDYLKINSYITLKYNFVWLLITCILIFIHYKL